MPFRPIFANRENLTEPTHRVRLKELLEANQALMTVYLLKDDLKQRVFPAALSNLSPGS
jgi:hypothetical protein